MTASANLPFTPSFFANDFGGHDVRTGNGDFVGRTVHLFGDDYSAEVAIDGSYEETISIGTFDGEATAQDALLSFVASGKRPEPNPSRYAVGARVYHERYGFGTIRKIGFRKPVRVAVKWDETGLTTFVGLTTIEVMGA